ncbi:allophanate hydrolase subunit 2 family protein [Hafnia paralvei]|uniref:5-oxoprolinase subunit PxpC n=1 Tax=Hafnia paralvei TaxID=546367 RepID=UPI000DF361F1|nr:5-oxoprolinase subunit PxpC [Hafnia paralvei]RDA67661.1 allophanate hydrolase subunit 2 family protein [Hafnia paralvei]RDA68526.1 allophanate hydrolase subunit 2 family protein [Hafnia paralvei]RDA68816.1 allophanate hydrolase subunit 2 family protein [Hafnia paralvei]RDA78479.1 allophanate hydrolase subunit 2 family protein [Hafnia paralvei]RDA79128.1 allophanate hydrolase subunit 2 family protein [Hafnia paralvei]
MLNIIRAGLQTTVQDQGRNGLRGQGVSLGGALDAPALYAANLLVGNRGTDAGLEVTLGECTVEFTRDGWMALTGAGCDAYLDKQRIWTGWNYPVRAGQRLVLHRPKRGMRSYLAVSGGIDVPKVLGSRSTDLTGGFGGLDGRKLKDGDVLPLGEVRRVPQKSQGIKQLLFNNYIRVLPGPEYQEFSPEEQAFFWRTPWHLSPQSNRMGYRLNGHSLRRSSSREMFAHGLLPGVIQVPHGGQPIVLMADAQTTGGYPRIACVIEADLYHLAQIRLGEPIHFIRCTLAEAQQAYKEQKIYLRQLERGLQGD